MWIENRTLCSDGGDTAFIPSFWPGYSAVLSQSLFKAWQRTSPFRRYWIQGYWICLTGVSSNESTEMALSVAACLVPEQNPSSRPIGQGTWKLFCVATLSTLPLTLFKADVWLKWHKGQCQAHSSQSEYFLKAINTRRYLRIKVKQFKLFSHTSESNK